MRQTSKSFLAQEKPYGTSKWRPTHPVSNGGRANVLRGEESHFTPPVVGSQCAVWALCALSLIPNNDGIILNVDPQVLKISLL